MQGAFQGLGADDRRVVAVGISGVQDILRSNTGSQPQPHLRRVDRRAGSAIDRVQQRSLINHQEGTPVGVQRRVIFGGVHHLHQRADTAHIDQRVAIPHLQPIETHQTRAGDSRDRRRLRIIEDQPQRAQHTKLVPDHLAAHRRPIRRGSGVREAVADQRP